MTDSYWVNTDIGLWDRKITSDAKRIVIGNNAHMRLPVNGKIKTFVFYGSAIGSVTFLVLRHSGDR